MTTASFDALLIDFYGTISARDREAVLATCENVVETCDLPLAADALAIRWGELFFQVIDRSNHDSFQTLHQCELASLTEVLAEFDRDHDPAPLVSRLEDYWTDPPIHPDALEFLNLVDLPICCVSNADNRPLTAAIAKHGLRFDKVVTSETARCYKPCPDIFQQALDALGVRPERTLHVGDSLHSDIGGAEKLGITTVWIQRNSRIHDIGSSQPDHIIHTLTDLALILDE